MLITNNDIISDLSTNNHKNKSLLNYVSSLRKSITENKKWRWWNLLYVLLIFLLLNQFFTIFSIFDSLNKEHLPTRIVKRQYPFKAYTHLDTQVESQIAKGTRVYHVTKEFGPATISELGKTVTALAAAQQASNLTEVAIVMPFYTFTRKWITDKEIDMVIDIRGKRPNEVFSVEFRVWKMLYAFNPPVQKPNVYEWQMINNVNTSVMITPQRPPAPTDAVPVYMIGSGNFKPFNQAFKARSVDEMNDERQLSLEWRDQYFAKAAAAFLAHKATATDEESIFAPIRIVPRVDIVHIHGASNAYVAKLLHDKKEADDLGPRPPAIVYTMYDQKKEMNYTNTFRNVRKFSDHLLADRESLQKYLYDGKIYLSKLAIDRAEAVVYNDRTTAAKVIEGRQDFHLRDLVMDNLLKKAERARFYGINGGVDLYEENPFITDKLIHRDMGFPTYALDLIKQQAPIFSTHPSRTFSLVPLNETTYWTLSDNKEDRVSYAKGRAKSFLIRQKVLNEGDRTRPIVLYRKNLTKRSGFDDVRHAAELFEKYNMHLIVLGSHGPYSKTKLRALSSTYPDHITFISEEREIKKFAIFLRAAADFVLDPNPKRAHDDRDILKDMAFGAAPITTATGLVKGAFIDRTEGREFLVTKQEGNQIASDTYFNSYVYNSETFESALKDAAYDFERTLNDENLREESLLRIIRSALNLGWDRGKNLGPVHEYNQVYQLALEDRFIPELKRHEVEQEHELISRLQETDSWFDWEMDYK